MGPLRRGIDMMRLVELSDQVGCAEFMISIHQARIHAMYVPMRNIKFGYVI